MRETIMGRESFDYAFKEYSRRWAFKHPTPADFFRTMGDASAENLDWFFRGWFYGTDACDISLDSVKWSNLSTEQIKEQAARITDRKIDAPAVNDYEDISKIRNRTDPTIKFAVDQDESLRDFYWKYDRNMVTLKDTVMKITRPGFKDEMTAAEKQSIAGNKNIYELSFSNKGGLVMPIIVQFTYKDGTKEVEYIPAQIWRKNENNVVKTFVKNKEVASIMLDPYRETADIDETNNGWNQTAAPSKFQLYKNSGAAAVRGASTGGNPMQQENK